MSNTKWTPGPWGVIGATLGEEGAFAVPTVLYEIAARDMVASQANANLIAAAPDLYDALWVLTEHNLLYYGEHHNTVIAGRAALAKARGES